MYNNYLLLNHYVKKSRKFGVTMDEKLSHFDDAGNAIMVDVSNKEITSRTAIAQGKIIVNDAVMKAIINKEVKKGDVLGVARVAGIMGVKRTWELIPMCHPLMIQKCSVDFQVEEEKNTITAICTVKVEGKTGVEMEALTGVNITLLTIYDMCKAIDKSMEMTDIHLVEKTGGKSGTFHYVSARIGVNSDDR
ncbi:MAG: moaC [Anaerocolumna sp.]|jgi:cyclic pyranopterin phosphate synthase|nr:moaC [Anaerocolumna sp.]